MIDIRWHILPLIDRSHRKRVKTLLHSLVLYRYQFFIKKIAAIINY